eukprot:TRINITY_DN160_c0_g1_i1.p1 TRINITY_DN160_c0_g1~~TRINITY_DN160_c0_g1_i1.p1  ORF type:complete len:430 (-),score=121.50 TRINITY_DN160_c0_g1_i1:253-1542(-)
MDPNELLRLKKQLEHTTTRVRTSEGKIFEEDVKKGSKRFLGTEALPKCLADIKQGISTLSTGAFDPSTKKWKSILSPYSSSSSSNLSSSSSTKLPLLPPSLSFVTFNVWFSDFMKEVRARTLFNIIDALKERPDFICFQEVTSEFLNWLLAEPLFQNNYYLSDFMGSTIIPYGVINCCSKSLGCIPTFTAHLLPTTMGRRLVTACCVFQDPTVHVSSSSSSSSSSVSSSSSTSSSTLSSGSSAPSTTVSSSSSSSSASTCTVCVGTVHLESLSNATVRAAQMGIIFPLLEQYTHSFLMGDFNFGEEHYFSTEIEQLKKHSKWLDSWTLLEPAVSTLSSSSSSVSASSSSSVSSSSRSSIVTHASKQGMGRFDRILCCSEQYKPVSLAILGDQKINSFVKNLPSNFNRSIYPSDHCGLHAHYQSTFSTSP